MEYNEQAYRPLMPHGQITHYDDVPINKGHCFDPVLGLFKVPQNGVFMFEINLRGCKTRVIIKVNGKNYERIHFEDRFKSVKVTVPLNEGDEIAFHNSPQSCEWKGYVDVNYFMVI